MQKEKEENLSHNFTADRNSYMDCFRKNVCIQMQQRDMTLKELSELSGIAYSTISTFLYGNATDCKLSTVVALARAFHVSIDELVDAGTINPITRESLSICRELPEHSLYLIRWLIRHQRSMMTEFSKHGEKVISVMLPQCVNGHLHSTNIMEPLNIDDMPDSIKAKTFIGLKISCDHYMPHYSPYDILLLACDREAYNGERCVILYYDSIFVVTKKESIVDGKKQITYVGIRNDHFTIKEEDVDEIVGYICGVHH